ncbi:MAG: hypothetical protein ACRC8K_18585 [Waterburya sp.]
MNIIRAERSIVKFCDALKVEGYLLPSGEFRVGKGSAALSVGFAENYLGRLLGTSPKQFKALQDNGFTGLQKTVSLKSIKGGGTSAETLSLSDYKALIIFAAGKGKLEAQALMSALLDVGLEDWFRLSFGQEQLTLEEKRNRFYKSYAATIDWLLEDKHENLILLEAEQFWQFGQN